MQNGSKHISNKSFDIDFYAEQIATEIKSSLDSKNEPIYNIRGPWGLGKTHLAELIQKKLEDKKVRVIKIDAWLVNDQKGIFKYLTSKLLNANQNFCFNFQCLLKKIPCWFWCFVIPILAILLLSWFRTDLYEPCWNGNGWTCDWNNEKVKNFVYSCLTILLVPMIVYYLDKDYREPWQLKDFLGKRKEKTVVIFDEIDRLEAKQIQYIFMLATDALSVPNVRAILCYDYDVIIQKLESDLCIQDLGNKYLNKIEDVIFQVSYINKADAEEVLLKCLSFNLEEELEDLKDLIQKEQIDKVLTDNFLCSNRRTFFQYINNIKRFLPVLRRTINQEEMITTLLSIEKLKLLNFQLFSNYLQKCNEYSYSPNSMGEWKGRFDSIKNNSSDSQELICNLLGYTGEISSEEIQLLISMQPKGWQPFELVGQYYRFQRHPFKDDFALSVMEVKERISFFIKEKGFKNEWTDDSCKEVIKRFVFLSLRHEGIKSLKPQLFGTLREVIFNSSIREVTRFQGFFNDPFTGVFEEPDIFNLLISLYLKLLLDRENGDFYKILNDDLSKTTDPFILFKVFFNLESLIGDTQEIIEDHMKNIAQKSWLNSTEEFNSIDLSCILGLWQRYSGDTHFISQFIEKYPEMSLRIISQYKIPSRQSHESYSLVNMEGKVLSSRFSAIDFYSGEDFMSLRRTFNNQEFITTLYSNIKKNLPRELFDVLNRDSLVKSQNLLYDERLYRTNDKHPDRYIPTLEHNGVLFCQIYEEQNPQK